MKSKVWGKMAGTAGVWNNWGLAGQPSLPPHSELPPSKEASGHLDLYTLRASRTQWKLPILWAVRDPGLPSPHIHHTLQMWALANPDWWKRETEPTSPWQEWQVICSIFSSERHLSANNCTRRQKKKKKSTNMALAVLSSKARPGSLTHWF